MKSTDNEGNNMQLSQVTYCVCEEKFSTLQGVIKGRAGSDMMHKVHLWL